MKRFASCIAALAAAVLVVSPALAQKKYGPGVTDTEIKIGQTMPYSGPASAYGVIGKAEAAYFAMINDQGGVNGRKINLISLDDGYSPPRTVEQTRKLVEQEEVLLIFQSLGTPTNTATQKYLNAKKVPQLFLASGASKWGDPKNFPWTMGWNPTYQAEGRIYAQHILETKPDAKIAVLYQNDDFGKDYVAGFKGLLGDKATKLIVAEQTYEVTDPTVDSQVVSLKSSGADVLVTFATPKFAAQVIRKVYDKDATDPQWKTDPAFKVWDEWMKKYHKGADPLDGLNAYGYTTAQTLVHVLKACGDDLSRENVMRQAANLKGLELPMLLPGIKLNTSPTDFYPIGEMVLTRFDGKRWVVTGKLLSGR